MCIICIICGQCAVNTPFIRIADWNWYSSNKISFIDSWMEAKLKKGSVITILVSAKSTCSLKHSKTKRNTLWCTVHSELLPHHHKCI